MKAQSEETILLVEDDPAHVDLALIALEQLRLASKVAVATNGNEALKYLADEELPTLVLLDLNLPDIDGWEILRRIRGQERTHPLRVIVVSSAGEEREIRRSSGLGADGFIVKPITAQKLITEAALRVECR